MDIYLIAMITFAAYFATRFFMNDLTAEKAVRLLDEGAVLIDVRTEEEYQAAHLKRAINVPLSEMSAGIERIVPERDSVVLLHCRSGSRSFVGKRLLKKMQYHKVYNLGSFSRAKRMVSNESHS
ncbi:MAG: rhodanese-like domain-containing protein [Nitrospirota bacterium]